MNRCRNFIVLFLVAITAFVVQARTIRQDSSKRIERHEFIQVGNHPQELRQGDYVVVITTFTEEDARKMVKEYKRLNVPEPAYAYVSTKSLWYLYFDRFDDIEKARQRRDEIRQQKIFKDAWLVTIHGGIEKPEMIFRHEFLNRSADQKDMNAGNYVIVGAFENKQQAQNMVNELKKLEFTEIEFGYLKAKNLWYLHSASDRNLEKAKIELRNYQKLKMFKDAWLLTVN